MSVKTIFYTIIGTMLIIVVGSLTLEWYNVSTTSLQLGSIAKMSARQACVFFGQETYKREDFKDVNMNDIYSHDGTLVISGKFYDGSSAEDIYNNLYGNMSNFLKADGPVKQQFKGNWESLDLLINRNDEWGIGEFYREAMMTPLNMGIPYLEKDVIERIMKWNLASILNNGQITSSGGFLNLHQDEFGEYYALYKGFRVYVNRVEVTDIDYKIIDISTSSGQAEFLEYTNMDASIITDTTEGPSDERNKVCVAGISYKVPMKYMGITPIKLVAEYGWNQSVAGYDGIEPGETTYEWNNVGEANLEQGGFDGSAESGVLPVPGDLVYYIVR